MSGGTGVVLARTLASTTTIAAARYSTGVALPSANAAAIPATVTRMIHHP
jgi:hypothetical protein